MRFSRLWLVGWLLLALGGGLAGCDDDDTIEVPADNAAPAAADDIAMVTADTEAVVIAVLANDTDEDGDNLYIASVGETDNGGTVEIVGDTQLHYTPAAGFTGTEIFTYVAADGRGGEDDASVTVTVSPMEAAFKLQLLHASDMEGAGNAVEDAPRFSAVLDTLRAQSPANTLVLSSGDNYIPGPFFSASDDPAMIALVGDQGPGLGDIQMLNAMGFQASAMGNHEFDQGPARIASLIGSREVDTDDDGTPDSSYAGQRFPYLSANLDFSADADLAPFVVDDGAAPQPSSITKSVVVEVNGERIGVVGATTPTLPSISSAGDDIVVEPQGFASTPTTSDIAQLAAVIQQSVDALSADGVNKIVLLAHMQVLDIERQLAPSLRDVDIIVGGGSDTILADDNDRLRAGHTAAGEYPELYRSRGGDPVVLVNTDGQYLYVGRLVVGFDAQGRVLTDTLDSSVNGAYATDEEGVAALEATPIAEVAEIAGTIGDILNERESNILGKTTVFLNGARADLVGEGQNFGGVRTEETNLGNLSADANLFVAQQVDETAAVSIKNGGGIRNFIGVVVQPAGSTDPSQAALLPPQPLESAGKEEGDISQFDIQNALSFNNGLTLLTVTAEELKDIVEHAVAAYPAVAGQFGQFGGLRFSFDPTAAARTAAGNGERVQSLVVIDADGAGPGTDADVVVQNGEVVGDAGRTFRIVTLNFLADGGDAYPFPELSAPDRVEVTGHAALDEGVATFAEAGSEQDALAEYLAQVYSAETPFAEVDTPVELDERIQNLMFRSDTVIAAP